MSPMVGQPKFQVLLGRKLESLSHHWEKRQFHFTNKIMPLGRKSCT